MELSSRANAAEMRSLLVKLLNQGNKEVQAAHGTALGRMYRSGILELPADENLSLIEFDENGTKLAMTVQDPLDLEATLKIQPAAGKRRPMKPPRYEEKYPPEIDEPKGKGKGKRKGKDKGKGSTKPHEEEDTARISVHVKYSALLEKMRGGQGKMTKAFTPKEKVYYSTLLEGRTPAKYVIATTHPLD